MKKQLGYNLTVLLLRLVLLIMPKHRKEWAQAMLYETMHQSSEFQALIWVLGCLKTAIMERMKMMETGTLRVSKFVLSLEILCCFIPVSLALTEIAYGELPKISWGLTTTEFYLLIFVVLAFIGPVGIFIGLRVLLRGSLNIGVLLKSVLYFLSTGIIVVGILPMVTGVINWSDWWLVILMICLLPALTVFHIIYISVNEQKIAI